MTDFKTYSFKNVNVIFGVLELEGFMDGDDVVNIEQENDQFSKHIGAKGDATRTQSSDSSCRVTIKLKQTSNSNAALNTIHVADKETGAGYAPMTINDKETGETYVIPNAWIVKNPTITRGQNLNSMDWIFDGDQLISVIV